MPGSPASPPAARPVRRRRPSATEVVARLRAISGMDMFSPLVVALIAHDLAAVKTLLRAGFDASESSGDEQHTPLMVATRHLVDAIIPLVNAGARVDALDCHGSSALVWAVGRPVPSSGADPVELLLAAGAEVNPNGTATLPLHEAIRNAPERVPRLLDAGADPNGTRDVSALGLAVFLASSSLDPGGLQAAVILALLEAGARVPWSTHPSYPSSPEGLALVSQFEESRLLARRLPPGVPPVPRCRL